MIRSETFQTLEFDKILHAVAGFANSEATREEISRIAPLTGREEIERRFGQVEEIRNLIRLGVPLQLSSFYDIEPVLELVRPQGAILNPGDLLLLLPALQVMSSLAKQIRYRTDIPLLKELAAGLTGFPELVESLEQTVDRDGSLLDSASRLLSELRSRKRGLTARIRKRLEEIVRERQTAIFLQDDFITQRSGRWVIPVRMDSKGMVPGVVHDVSNTGETAFIEPLEIIGLVNELENLVAEEKAEQIRILREISRWIREDAEEMAAQYRTLVQLDLLHSIARCSDLLQAEVPTINDTSMIRLRGARHPLLMLLSKERKSGTVVPLDLDLGGDADLSNQGEEKKEPDRIMVITGPNTGGKTIAIKTVGLLLIMALSGLPVPAASTSSFPLVDDLLADIGDEQAIESSLSTFSAHVSNIAGILRRGGARTVVLLDELGTGTEPAQGAAIACGVLHELQAQGALVFATTHLTDIVGFVHKAPGMTNAAMEFNRDTLTPLYRLKCGEPGQSHAIEVARRYGLPENVIQFALGMVGRVETEFHALIDELQGERRRYEELVAELQQRESAFAEREKTLAERLAAAEEGRRETLAKAWQEAKDVVQAAKREMNAVIDEAKREKRAAAARMAESERQIEAQLRELSGEPSLSLDRLKEGEKVFVRSLGTDAQVVKIDRRQERLRVRAGGMEAEVGVADVSPARGKSAGSPRHGRRGVGDEEEVRSQFNIIGLRVDDALPLLETYLNHVSLAGLGEVRIVHGVGTGALQRAVREHLTNHPLVAGFRSGEPHEGRAGVTVVTLR